MSATNWDVQSLSEIRCPRRWCFDLVHVVAEVAYFQRNSRTRDVVSVCVCVCSVCGFGNVCLLCCVISVFTYCVFCVCGCSCVWGFKYFCQPLSFMCMLYYRRPFVIC